MKDLVDVGVFCQFMTSEFHLSGIADLGMSGL